MRKRRPHLFVDKPHHPQGYAQEGAGDNNFVRIDHRVRFRKLDHIASSKLRQSPSVWQCGDSDFNHRDEAHALLSNV